jgi:hypothetical protein
MSRRSLVSTAQTPPTHHLRLAKRLAQSLSKQNLIRIARSVGPSLVALTFASAAHAQGTMDFSGAQTLMGTFNSRFAYVSVSWASHDAQIYTNSAASLAENLSHEVSKSAAVNFSQSLGRAVSEMALGQAL